MGLLGGSFDPAHEGHLAISLVALSRFALDEVWWLVAPQNPLKPPSSPYAGRLAGARAMARHPRIRVSDIERRLGTYYTVDTLEALGRRFPAHRFVWIMGADSFAGLHRWHRWRTIMETVPVAVMNRPGHYLKAAASPAARRYAAARVPQHEAASLPTRSPPAWAMVTFPLRHESSTAIRARRLLNSAAVPH